MELIGICKNCLGCNRVEDKNFKGTYRCEYATTKQVSIEDLRKELKKNEIVRLDRRVEQNLNRCR